MKIREIREEKGLSQKELASKLGVSPTNIYNYEVGRTEPNIEMLVKIADILQVSIDYLLERSDDFGTITVNNTLTREEQRLLNAFNKLNDVTREKLIEDAEFYAGNVGAGATFGAVRK